MKQFWINNSCRSLYDSTKLKFSEVDTYLTFKVPSSRNIPKSSKEDFVFKSNASKHKFIELAQEKIISNFFTPLKLKSNTLKKL